MGTIISFYSFLSSYVYLVENTVIQIILIMKIFKECPFNDELHIKHVLISHTIKECYVFHVYKSW